MAGKLIDRKTISEWLSTQAKEFCTDSGKAMPLTELGAAFSFTFKKRFQHACDEANIPSSVSKLAPFIMAFCPDLEILPFDDMLDRAAVRPRDMPGVPHPAEVSTFSGPEALEPRFVRAFWTSFIKPLANDARRLLNIEPGIWFQDVPDTHEPELGQIEIQKDFIIGPNPDAPLSNDQVHEKITRWLEQNKLSQERFIYRGKSLESWMRRETASLDRAPSDAKQDIPRRFFNLLPDEMKKRLQVPADIVEYLMSLPK